MFSMLFTIIIVVLVLIHVYLQDVILHNQHTVAPPLSEHLCATFITKVCIEARSFICKINVKYSNRSVSSIMEDLDNQDPSAF